MTACMCFWALQIKKELRINDNKGDTSERIAENSCKLAVLKTLKSCAGTLYFPKKF